MLVRVGDEKRDMREEHLRKLKDFLLSAETQKNYKEVVLNVFKRCVASLPHKVFLYATLTTLLITENETFGTSLVEQTAETLKELLTNFNAEAVKAVVRYLASLVTYRVLDSKTFTILIIQLLEETERAKDFGDLVLEAVIGGLPICSQTLTKE